MPPKGWRKNADGSYPVPSREREITSINDILFPKATVVRIAKEAFPQGSLLSKDSAEVLQRSATVYVNFIAEYARNVAMSRDRTLVTANDVIEAFNIVGFQEFSETMSSELEEYNKKKEAKKKAKVGLGQQGSFPVQPPVYSVGNLPPMAPMVPSLPPISSAVPGSLPPMMPMQAPLAAEPGHGDKSRAQ